MHTVLREALCSLFKLLRLLHLWVDVVLLGWTLALRVGHRQEGWILFVRGEAVVLEELCWHGILNWRNRESQLFLNSFTCIFRFHMNWIDVNLVRSLVLDWSSTRLVDVLLHRNSIHWLMIWFVMFWFKLHFRFFGSQLFETFAIYMTVWWQIFNYLLRIRFAFLRGFK